MMSKLRKRRKCSAFDEACRALCQVRAELDGAYCLFNSTADPDLLEASIFQISALQSKYNGMLRKIKKVSEA